MPHREVVEQSEVGAALLLWPSGKQPSYNSQLQGLNDHGWIPSLGLADQKMKMFGHDHVGDDHILITLAYLFENLHEQIAPPGTSQEGLPLEATCGDKVQIAAAVKTLEAFGHSLMLGTTRGECL